MLMRLFITTLLIQYAQAIESNSTVPMNPMLDRQESKDVRANKGVDTPLWIFYQGQSYQFPVRSRPDKPVEEIMKSGAVVSESFIQVPSDSALPVDFVLDRYMERVRSAFEDLHQIVSGNFSSKGAKFRYQIARSLDLQGCRFYEIKVAFNDEEFRCLIGSVDRTIIYLNYRPKRGEMTVQSEAEWEAILENFHPKERIPRR